MSSMVGMVSVRSADALLRDAARSTRAESYSSGLASPTSNASARFSMRASRDGPPCDVIRIVCSSSVTLLAYTIEHSVVIVPP
jgi:hypothetical protein